MAGTLLIRNADIWQIGPGSVRVESGCVAAIGALTPNSGEQIIDARGGALLPGLHDHHIHLAALAARRQSVPCGPPDVRDAAELAVVLGRSGSGWLRGFGYHESLAGMLDAEQLDALVPNRPVRIQHRTGRMWFLNSAALEIALGNAPAPLGLERIGGRLTGRLFDEDAWLRSAIGGTPPDLGEVGQSLARMGVTGVTDMSPANDDVMAQWFIRAQADGFAQKIVAAGTLELAHSRFTGRMALGPAKLHLHEAQLPDFDAAITFIASAHDQHRPVAVHCTTETELVFALATLEAAGVIEGDRVEHASITPDSLIREIARLNLHVVAQPHFIAERGDQYLRDVDPRDHAALYRLASFDRAGVTMRGGSDAPYGSADPWAAMRAATQRLTPSGVELGADEALAPERALSLFLADPIDLTRERSIRTGEPADFCLLHLPWAQARNRLVQEDVCMTVTDGSIVYDRVDQSPVEGGACRNAAA